MCQLCVTVHFSEPVLAAALGGSVSLAHRVR
jgi:hypothetical protein